MFFQRLGGAHIGGHHHFFNQLMRFKAGWHIDAGNLAIVVHLDASFGAVYAQRLALFACLGHALISLPKRLQKWRVIFGKLRLDRAVKSVLRLAVTQLHRHAHQSAIKLMAAFFAIGTNGHAHGHARPRLALAQRA